MTESRFGWIPADDLPPGTSAGFFIHEGAEEKIELLCCTPVTEIWPRNAAEVTECSACHVAVWRSLAAPKEFKVVCTHCMVKFVSSIE